MGRFAFESEIRKEKRKLWVIISEGIRCFGDRDNVASYPDSVHSEAPTVN